LTAHGIAATLALVDDAEAEEYYGGDYLQDILVADLLQLGGPNLLDQAHDQAGLYVDERYPWDGHGNEPPERVSAYCAVLWQVAEQTRRTQPTP
jgi:hypothetical protein